MRRTLIGAKVEPKAAKILDRAAKKSKISRSAYCAAVLERHASVVALTLRAKPKKKPVLIRTRKQALEFYKEANVKD